VRSGIRDRARRVFFFGDGLRMPGVGENRCTSIVRSVRLYGRDVIFQRKFVPL
jgi:hypothetical protein